MQLVFCWFEEKEMIKESGFNFSPLHFFKVEKDKSGSCWRLIHIPNKSINIMHSQEEGKAIIENVTALVGNNGVGKTSLIDSILELRAFSENIDKIPSKKVIYILEENGTYFLETNICEGNLCFDIDNDEENLFFEALDKTYYDGKSAKSQLKILNGEGIYNISSVYMTNAAFNQRIRYYLDAHLGIEALVFSPERLGVINRDFCGFIIPELGIRLPYNLFENYCITLKMYKTQNSGFFQQYCDILYFLYKRDNLESWINRDIRFEIIDIYDILDKMKDYYLPTGSKEDDIINMKKEWIIRIEKLLGNQKNTLFLSDRLSLYLVLEYVLTCIDNDYVDNAEEILHIIEDSNILKAIEYIKKSIILIVNDNEKRRYFNRGLTEIEDIHRIEKNNDYNGIAGLNISVIEQEAIDFYTFILECLKYNYNNKNQIGSFSLRYISVNNLFLASGERAYLNIMSWLNYVSIYNEISNKGAYFFKKNIHIFIDEIDALCHPEWQRDIIGVVIAEIKKQYLDYNIQLIISTHSPLCLSNIPKENIIFLKRDAEMNIIQDYSDKYQTFARNIYDILNDSYYLEGKTVGRIAIEYINKLMQEIDDIDVSSPGFDSNNIKQKIDYIGDSLIKWKLAQRLNNRINAKKSIESELVELKRKQSDIEKRIAVLEKGDN